MKRMFALLTISLLLSTFWGCAGSHEQVATGPRPQQTPDVRIMVAKVTNNTRQLFDVDVIGMLWNSLDQSLKSRGLLWTPNSQGPVAPLRLEAHVVKYQEGSAWYRCILPMWGKTLLKVKCDLKRGDTVIARAESAKTFTFANGTFTRGAWKKVFADVADELVAKLSQDIAQAKSS